MPKRGSKTRGAARGDDSSRNFNVNMSHKRRANKNKAALHCNHQSTEPMHMENDGCLHEAGMSMNSLSKRPNRRIMAGVDCYDKQTVGIIARPLRYRPVEFVVSKVVYDPGRQFDDHLKRLEQNAGLLVDMRNLILHLESIQPPKLKLDNAGSISKSTNNDEKNSAKTIGTVKMVEDTDALPWASAETRFEAIEIQDQDVSNDRKCDVPMDSNAKFVTQNFFIGSQNDAFVSDRLLSNYDNFCMFLGSNEDTHIVRNSSSERKLENFFSTEKDADDNSKANQAIQKASAVGLLKTENRKPQLQKQYHMLEWRQMSDTDNTSLTPESDSDFATGEVMPKKPTNVSKNFPANLPRSSKVTTDIKDTFDFSNTCSEEASGNTDEEAVFEIYKAHIIGDLNFNLGNGDSDDREPVLEYADLDGVESFEHGHGNHDNGNGADSMENRKFHGVYVSYNHSDTGDSSDFDTDTLKSDEEGLGDILSFARIQQKAKSLLELPLTETSKKKGKGKKQRLELGSHLELELRESLMAQFQYQRQSKKEKILQKKEKRHREGIELRDLTIKYDYSLHIQEITDEFEAFLHDSSRQTMSFPPLDPHGNKTIDKLAGYYNMKCIRCGGNGFKLYMKIAKTRKTSSYPPAYDQITYIKKQRPVFNRVDKKPRTQAEIATTDGKQNKYGPKSSATIREGDVVGGQAPEIENNNIGRQLLEQLGWIRGEGLGAHGNKGISEPLTATVKRSKTGLK